jgi:hypothetical protein
MCFFCVSGVSVSESSSLQTIRIHGSFRAWSHVDQAKDPFLSTVTSQADPPPLVLLLIDIIFDQHIYINNVLKTFEQVSYFTIQLPRFRIWTMLCSWVTCWRNIPNRKTVTSGWLSLPCSWDNSNTKIWTPPGDVSTQTWRSLLRELERSWMIQMSEPSWTMFAPLHFPPKILSSVPTPGSIWWVSNCPTGSSCVPSRWTLCWTQWWWVEAATPMIENPLRNISSTVTWLPTWGSNHLAICCSITFNQCCWTMFNGCFSFVYLRTVRND